MTPLCCVHESLSHIAVDDELPVLHDLRRLVLCCSVNMHLSTVNTGGCIIAYVAVTVDSEPVSLGPEAVGYEPVTVKVVEHDSPPSLVVCLDDEPGRAFTSFNRKLRSVDDQNLPGICRR